MNQHAVLTILKWRGKGCVIELNTVGDLRVVTPDSLGRYDKRALAADLTLRMKDIKDVLKTEQDEGLSLEHLEFAKHLLDTHRIKRGDDA